MRKARSPRRDAHCGGRLHGTNRMPGSTAATCVTERSLARSIRTLHHRQMVPGERATRLWAFDRRRSPRLHHLDFKISSVSSFSGSAGLETKNPSGALAREGFDQLELRNSVTPFLPHESACTGNPVQSTRRPNSDCRSCLACRRSRLSRARIAPRRVRCMIAVRGEVKAVCGRIFGNVQTGRALVNANHSATPASRIAKIRRTISSRFGSASAR